MRPRKKWLTPMERERVSAKIDDFLKKAHVVAEKMRQEKREKDLNENKEL